MALTRDWKGILVNTGVCPMALDLVFGVAGTRIQWKGEESVDDGESEPEKSRPMETRQGPAKVTRP